MFNRILANISSRSGISALRRILDSPRRELEQFRTELGELGKQVRGLQTALQSLQQSQADQELRAAGWHADMINRQRKLEDMLARFGSWSSTERSDGAISSRSSVAVTEIQNATPPGRATQ